MLSPMLSQTIPYSLLIEEPNKLMTVSEGLAFGLGGLAATGSVHTAPAQLRALALLMRNATESQQYTLVDIAVVDKLANVGRFVVYYHFLSPVLNQRKALQLFVTETTTIPSLAAPFMNKQKIFAGAGWLEREVWDMFGCYFSEHGDLRRILTDYGFTGHPLRKDFPLTGFVELLYNDAEGRVTAESVELAQEFRVFHG
jgi:NADH:ubiquinone oxidoreductase subunit C